MAESDEEMDYMSEKELRIAYRKLFAMSPEMSIGKFSIKSPVHEPT